MADHVAAILEQWRRERPDLDVSPVGIFGRISRIERRKDAALGPVHRRHGIDGRDYDVLAALRRAGEPYVLTPTQLYRSLLVTAGTMTGQLDRLEDRGLVERRPSPSDRRSVAIALTPAGMAVQEAVLGDLLATEAGLLEGMAPAERDRLAGLLATLTSLLDEAAGGS